MRFFFNENVCADVVLITDNIVLVWCVDIVFIIIWIHYYH